MPAVEDVLAPARQELHDVYREVAKFAVIGALAFLVDQGQQPSRLRVAWLGRRAQAWLFRFVTYRRDVLVSPQGRPSS